MIDPLGTKGGGSAENLKNTVIPKTEIVIKFKWNILKNYSPRTLPRKDFYAKTCFPLFYFNLKPIVSIVSFIEV